MDSGRLLSLTVVTVTYGDRWMFLSQVLGPLFASSLVNRVFVVDNGSLFPISAKIPAEFADRTTVVRLENNTGSANGFGVGLKAAASTGAGFILMLDDDNVLEEDAISKLMGLSAGLGNDPFNVIVCLRTDRKEYVSAIKLGRLKSNPSAFLGFSVGKLFKKNIRFTKDSGDAYPIVPADRAPYGGTLLHSDLIRLVGLPNRDFFLYFDDVEFSIRLRSSGARIYLSAGITIRDVDTSWNRVEAKGGHYLFSKYTSEKKAYYVIRNDIFLAKARGISFRYFVNLCVYLMFSFSKTIVVERSLRAIVARIRLVFGAINDGWRGRLGELSNM